MADQKPLSLYSEIHARGFEAAIVATYNANFEFYERVVLRRLQAVGCRHQLLLMDASQCAKGMADPLAAPQFAGADYALIPIRTAGGAFHPKFVLLLGRKKARLLVGSHNVTVCGFGVNREVTSGIDIDSDGPSAALAKAVWGFVRRWTADLAPELQSVVSATERIAPWLAAVGTTEPKPPVLVTTPGGPTLWAQLRPRLARKVTQVTVISPYFDGGCAFLRQLERDLAPKELVVALELEHSVIPEKARSLVRTARFVDITALSEEWRKQRLHAKLLRFEFEGGGSLVVSGSANASAPAWTSTGNAANAEMVVVHEDGDHVWKALGLEGIAALPLLTDADWDTLAQRQAVDPPDKAGHVHAPYLALEGREGFLVPAEFAKGLEPSDVEVVCGIDASLPVKSLHPAGEGVLCGCPDAKVRADATFLRGHPARGPVRVAIIHRITTLLDRAAGSTQQAFRKALGGLEGDPDQLEELLRIVDKAIFDGGTPVEQATASTGRMGKQKADPENSETEPESLMVPAGHTLRGRRRRKVAASSDLAAIIDLLIFRLGQGLRREDTDTADTVRPKEQTEDDPNDQEDRDGHALAKLCRSKVNRLFSRMTRHMEQAVDVQTSAATPLIQLAAVLGVVKHLRVHQSGFAWLPRGEELLDHGKTWEFFKNVCRLLYSERGGLAARAVAENGGEDFEELTIVRGLLMWLAFDCDLDVRTALAPLRDEPQEAIENLVGVAFLLPLATECAHDDKARELLLEAAGEMKGVTDSAEYHLAWATTSEASAKHATDPAVSLAVGDLAMSVKMPSRWPLVVAAVEHNKVGVVDLETGNLKRFATGFLAKVAG